MKKKKFMMTSLLLTAIIVATIFAVVFNGIILNYIDTEARRSILEDINYEEDDRNFSFTQYENALFRPTVYVIDDHVFGIQGDWLVTFYSSNKEALLSDIQVKTHNNNRYYVKAMIKDDEVLVFYVNVTGTLTFIKNMNIVFATSLFIISFVLAYIGYQSGKKLDESDERVKMFYQNISHDLKTPLMVIEGYAESIEQGLIDDNKKAAKIIGQESDKMSRLITELLDLSKFESGDKKLHLSKTYIGELLLETLDRVSFLIEERNLDVALDVDDVVLNCDGDLIERVFMNLISNAIKHSEKKIMVHCKVKDKKALISIANDGTVLNGDERHHVFDRFYSKGNLSSGIGLTLSKEIITMHKGKIYVENDTITKFIIELPI